MSILYSFVEDFLRYLSYEKRYSPHTILNYQNDLRYFLSFLEQESTGIDHPAHIKALQIRTWFAILKNDEGMSDTSLNRKRSSLSSFFKYLMKQGVIKSNPAKELRQLKTPSRLPQHLQEGEAIDWLENKNFGEDLEEKTQQLIAELLYQCGLRRQELITLRDKDVEYGMQQLRVMGKGSKERLIPIAPVLLELIRSYCALRDVHFPERAHEYLLVLKNGKPLYASYVYRFIKEELKEVSTLNKKSPHILRHTFATQLLNNGANIQAIKELLGHESLAATQVYTHTTIDRLRDIHKKNHPRG